MKTIRIGMIGANPRALWYAALFDDVDPERFAALVPAHYHHLTYYDREELWLNRARGFHLARVYDPDFTAAEQLPSDTRFARAGRWTRCPMTSTWCSSPTNPATARITADCLRRG